MDAFGQIIRKGSLHQPELTHRIERHLEFKTAVVNNKAIDRERIKKLVGQHHPTNRRIRQIIQRAPAQRRALHLIQPLFLAIPERGLRSQAPTRSAERDRAPIARGQAEDRPQGLRCQGRIPPARASHRHPGKQRNRSTSWCASEGSEIRTKGRRSGEVPRRTDLNLTSTVIAMGRMVQSQSMN